MLKQMKSWINKSINIRHWALIKLARNSTVVINAEITGHTLKVRDNHYFIHQYNWTAPETNPDPIIHIDNASYGTLSNSSIKGASGTAIFIEGGKTAYFKGINVVSSPIKIDSDSKVIGK